MTTDSTSPRALRRAGDGRLVAGVAAGLAEHFELDVTVVRLAFAVLALVGGAGIPLYVAAWLLIPEEGTDQSVLAELFSSNRIGAGAEGGQ